MWGEAAKRLSDAVNDELFRSLEGKSKHQLWLELCDIITKHPAEVSRLRVDAILRIKSVKGRACKRPSKMLICKHRHKEK